MACAKWLSSFELVNVSCWAPSTDYSELILGLHGLRRIAKLVNVIYWAPSADYSELN